MSQIESTLLTTCQKFAKQTIVIAYSGGIDSQVLLHALARLKSSQKITNPLLACHVDHGLSQQAKRWQLFAKEQCSALDIACEIKEVSLTVSPQQSVEAVARDARYQALQQVAPPNAIIITGHHQDDQAETFLLALKRGAGIKGLGAMKADMSLNAHTLLRPLLDISRKQIEHYADMHHLTWVDDESNEQTRFDRNFLRHEIMPVLTKRWPSIGKAIVRTTQHCQESQSLLDELAAQDFTLIANEQGGLPVDKLTALSYARYKNLLRFYLTKQCSLMPSNEQIRQTYLQLDAPIDKSPAIKVGDQVLRRFKNALYITPIFEDLATIEFELLNLVKKTLLSQTKNTLSLPDNLGELAISVGNCNRTMTKLNDIESVVDNKKILHLVPPLDKQKVTIKFSHYNPRVLPDYRNQSRPLKKVLQELSIPPWERKRLPFLYYGDTLVAVIGYFVCNDYVSKKSELNLCIDWQTS